MERETTQAAQPQKQPPGVFDFIIVSWPFFLNDLYLIPLTRTGGNTNLLWLLDIVFYCLIPTCTLWWLYKKGRLVHVAAAFKVPQKLWLHLLAGAALAVVTHLVFTRLFEPWCFAHGWGRLCFGYTLPQGSAALQLVVNAYAVLSAGILEETVFRAHLMGLAAQRDVGRGAAALLSSALFAGIHWCGGTGKLLSTFTIGLIPSAIYLRTGNLWLLMTWHTLHDLLAF